MCYYPRQALRSDFPNKSGKFPLTFIPKRLEGSFVGNPNLVKGIPCGLCTDCRLRKSRDWAIRMMHEASLYENNCFITLTFDDEHLNVRENPKSLDKSEFPLFLKSLRNYLVELKLNDLKKRYPSERKMRLRKIANRTYCKFRYYMCGEYGELTKRPHYHAVMFNLDFPDKKLVKVINGNRLYSSEVLSSLWPYGFSSIGAVTFDSCAYVARYIMKKQFGKDSWKHYFDYVDQETGEIVGLREKEYTTMSRRSGIGKEWLSKYLTDVYKGDKSSVFVRGKGNFPPPKYYDSQYEVVNPSGYNSVKQARISEAAKREPDDVDRHLNAKKVISDSRIVLLKRGL